MGMIEGGRSVVMQESAALARMASGLGPSFQTAAEWILGAAGRVITCGVGKSGHMARKAAGTFSSTGTPSFFLHASEAVHGDLGMVTPADIVLLYSQSGETDEVVRLFPSIRDQGAKTILITGRETSSGAREADLVLNTGVTEEACPHNLAPTTSAIAMSAMSDALAVAVMEARGFSRDDFARFHPSGALGKRLLLRVSDVMRPVGEIAVVAPDTDVLAVIREMTRASVGVACVVENGAYRGLISEGDLRRHLLAHTEKLTGTASDMVNPGAATTVSDLLAVEALEAFQNHPKKIGEMPVVADGALLGLLVLKDLLRAGIV
jgi:arabinose-5-phosphate isomerase